MIFEYEKYKLIGVGDFSHGNNNIWEYRLDMLNDIIYNTNKNIIIFNEDTIEHCNAIMNINSKLSYNKKYGVVNNYPYGPLEKYSYRVYDSAIYLDIIKYIRKNTNRITIIGVDNGELARDKEMAARIINQINNKCINIFWAHNAHVDSRKITEKYETEYSKEKYRAGYYLKKILKDQYCIILSIGYKGKIRFDCECSNDICTIRTPYKIPKFINIINKNYKKYITNNKHDLYDSFNDNIIEYSACTFPNNKFNITNNKYNFIIFFTKIKPLKYKTNT
jgi:hypothetical protein